MEEVQKKYSEVIAIYNALAAIDKNVKDKLSYAALKLLERYTKIIVKYNGLADDINITHAYTNEKGVLEYDTLKGETSYRYTKEGLKAKLKDTQELGEKLVNVPVYIYKGPDRDPDISLVIKMLLEGILFEAKEE